MQQLIELADSLNGSPLEPNLLKKISVFEF